MTPAPSPKAIKALILDIDGTLLRGKEPIPGIVELHQYLRSRRIPFVVASNNSTRSPADYQRKLAGFGVKLEPADILTSGVATAAFLQREVPKGSACYVIGEAALHEAILGAGLVVREDARERVAAVVVGGDSGLTYHKLKIATLLLQRGALFVGTNPDVVYPTEEGLIPDIDIEVAAGENVDRAVGRPLAPDQMDGDVRLGDQLHELDVAGVVAADLMNRRQPAKVDGRADEGSRPRKRPTLRG